MFTPQALSIAGSDSGGGAGIQADLKTFQMRRVFGTSVITAVTAQNTLGIGTTLMLPVDTVRAQLDALAADFHIKAFKTGMLGTADMIEGIVEKIHEHDFGTFVLDPVMAAKDGTPLLQKNALAAFKSHLLPLANVLTPNLPETYVLTGINVRTDHDAAEAAERLQAQGVQTVLIKGGHSENSGSLICKDWVFTPENRFVLESPRTLTRHTHGTGCTLSACITAELAKGASIEHAIRTAKALLSAAISSPLNIGNGQGPLNHWAMRMEN